MPPRLRVFWSGLIVAFTLLVALPLYTALSTRRDIWWTPSTMLVPLTESRDRVEIYVRGKPLGAVLEAGQLRITDEAGGSVLATSEVGLRFNNWGPGQSSTAPGAPGIRRCLRGPGPALSSGRDRTPCLPRRATIGHCLTSACTCRAL
jgi:hypothetical protein